MSAKVTLRRRDGGPTDTGWQLKLPTDDARTEVRLPPSAGAGVPKELRDLTAGLRRGRALRQVARIRTERTAHRLVDASGSLLVEIDDDRVHAATLGNQSLISTWREVEVELGAGDRGLQRQIVQRLGETGARQSAASSKLARAMADPAANDVAPNGKPSPTDSSTVGDLVLGYLGEQRQALLDGDLQLRGEADAVHHTRVAARRFRSTLRTYGSVFDAERAAAMDDELRWYSGVLGAVRDPDVLREHLHGVIAALPDEVVLGPVASRVEQHLIGEREQRRRTLLRALNGQRYFGLLDAIDQWIADPPFTANADLGKRRAREWAERAQRKLDKRLRVVAANDDDPAGVHRARKAAKRARYAVELAAPVLPARVAKRRIKNLKKVQDALGEFQDSVVANETLLHLGIRDGTTQGENGFTYGLLYALEQRRAELSRREVVDRLS
jgi:CHAD domain-containing protein